MATVTIIAVAGILVPSAVLAEHRVKSVGSQDYSQSAILPTVALHMLIKYVYMFIWARVPGTIVLFHLPCSWKYWRGFNFGELVILTVYTAKLNSCQN